MTPTAITIGRQFGSGGRIIAQMLANQLGYQFFDKQLLLEAAHTAGIIPELIQHKDERISTVFGTGSITTLGMGLITAPWTHQPNTVSDENIQCAIADTIRRIAATQNCVIVGRTADYVLRNHPRCTNIFIHAPEPDCTSRVIARGDATNPTQARALCRKINKLRSTYYNFYTDKRWGHSTSYHLCIDSSTLPPDQTAALLAHYITLRHP